MTGLESVTKISNFKLHTVLKHFESKSTKLRTLKKYGTQI